MINLQRIITQIHSFPGFTELIASLAYLLAIWPTTLLVSARHSHSIDFLLQQATVFGE